MERDGACRSVWQHALPSYTAKINYIPVGVQDVVIVGAGITGLTTALLLQQSGKHCLVIEAKNIGFGTTGGTTAHINTFLETPYGQIAKNFSEEAAHLVAQGAKEALNLIKHQVETLSLSCGYNDSCGYSEKPGYLFSLNDKQTEELKEIVDWCNKVGVTAGFTNSSPLPIPYQRIAVFEEQGQFHPLKYLRALARAFEDAGGILVQDCRLLQVEDNDPVEVVTTRGNVKCQQLIYATHIPPGVNLLHFRCAPYRSYVMAVRLKNNDYPQAMAYDMSDPYHYYRTQEIDGESFLIAGGEDHKTGHEENTEACFRRLESHVRTFYDVEDIAYKWSSQYFDPADGLPYIGHLPGHPDNIFVATGFGGNGMTFGTLSGIILRDMLVTGSSRYEKLFDPNRIKPVAGFNNFVKEAADVVGILVESVLPAKKLKTLADMAPGEGRIVELEGKKVGLYKDESGKLHAVHPGCQHIKCTVQWNMSEKSWDCPCHGSRYSYTGEMLTGPARKNLVKFEMEKEASVAKS